MIDIILTADYEIYGDGSGDVREKLIKPTEKILELCRHYGAKLTIFFEVVEYWAFIKAGPKGLIEDLGYDPAALMKQQLCQALDDGHDVQLHIHPQWLDSRYIRGKGWQLNLAYWRLPMAPGGLGSPQDINSLRGLFVKGKEELERMFKPLRSSYQCMAFRAGSWCMQPEQNPLRAMKEAGLQVDSSVVPGLYHMDDHRWIDYRNAPSFYHHWRTQSDNLLAVGKGDEGLVEMPVYVCMKEPIKMLLSNPWRIVGWLKEWQRERKAGSMNAQQGEEKSEGKESLLKRMFTPQPFQWDYCDLTSKEMWDFLKEVIERYEHEGTYIPLIMSGHPKDFRNSRQFVSFLERLDAFGKEVSRPQLGFATITEAWNRLVGYGF
jgi:hypothetical protein